MTKVIAVIGSRDWPDLDRVRRYIDRVAIKHPDSTIASGGAYGVDRAAEHEADHRGLGVVSLQPVDRDEHHTCELVHNERAKHLLMPSGIQYIQLLLEGTWPTFAAAAHHRNRTIALISDVIVAFWKPQSKGTLATINYAHELKRPVHIYKPT